MSDSVGHDRVMRGRTGEQVAASFLIDRGYRVLAKNQRTPMGELDLVCRTGEGVVVVEVKARSGDQCGSALEAIGPRKARRLRASAIWWLSRPYRTAACKLQRPVTAKLSKKCSINEVASSPTVGPRHSAETTA